MMRRPSFASAPQAEEAAQHFADNLKSSQFASFSASIGGEGVASWSGPRARLATAKRSESLGGEMVALGWLGASIVHDLRNPLGTIRSGSEILTDAAFNSAQVKRVARNIHHAAVRMEKLLNDLMASVRGNVTPPELCGLRDVIVSASEIVWAGGQHENVRLSLSEVPPDIHLPLRRSSMERTFVSLLVNSCEAMPQGGAIGIRAQRTEGHVFIEVHDSGPGIPDSIRDILFKPFVTAGKPTGMGLGLALARQTILYHGGDIWLEPGAGARFAMRLPLDQSRPQPGPNGLAL